MRNIKYSSGDVVATHDENPPGGGILRLMGSLFWVSVQKKLVLRLRMKETQLLSMVQNIHGHLQKHLVNTCFFFSQYGTIMKMACQSVT